MAAQFLWPNWLRGAATGWPSLASRRLGKGKGKCYYWNEQNIVAQACAAFDLLEKFNRPETVLWMLWLQGFQVPLPKLRRVWMSRSRLQKPWLPGDFSQASGQDGLACCSMVLVMRPMTPRQLRC